MTAFYGQDLHWRRQYRGLFTLVNADAPDPAAILQLLRQGGYMGLKDGLELASNGEIPAGVLARFERANARSQRLRQWIGGVKSCVNRVGLSVPGSVKAQLRRIF